MDAASVEQMNKLRKSLGLPLLPVPGAAPSGPTFKEHDSSDEEGEAASTLETREAAGFGNYQELQEQQRAAKRREAQKLAIAKARDAAKRFTRLEGKGLGDADDEADLDAKSWLKGQSKRQKKIEREATARLEAELAERERLATVQYSSKDLAGIKIAHEIDDFDEDIGEHILTLKDANIDEDDDEDELENAELVSKDKLNERLEFKKKKPVYDPNAIDDETGERKMLAQYDEEIDGKKRKRFTLDEAGTVIDEERDAKRQETGGKLRSQAFSLEILKDEIKSDYMDISEIKIKKPKKPKKPRQKTVDEDIFPEPSVTNGSAMELDDAPTGSRAQCREVDNSFIDDEDLQQSLAASRRAAFKKQKKMKPEDLAKRLQEEADTPEPGADAEEPGLVFDETSVFVDNLQATRPEARPEPKHNDVRKSVESPQEVPDDADEDGDVDMQPSYAGVEDEEDLLARLRREQATTTPELSGTGLETEATLDNGLGATLNLLKQRGLVKHDEEASNNELHRSRGAFLQARKLREAEADHKAKVQRERDRNSGKMAGMSNRERENAAQWSNQQRDQWESREQAKLFEQHYKPDVKLSYVDELGRTMNQKEAFKHLSHAFHGKCAPFSTIWRMLTRFLGKGSGKQKTEKRLKKIDEEKKREATSTLDSSQATGMNNAMGTTQRKNKQAGVRLG
jgi:U4/U6.U5 tri-snRNP-associated protein 1